MNTKFKTNLFNLAWGIARKENIPFAEALTAAWKGMKVKSLLQQGITEFDFVKADGSVRHAIGTLVFDSIPADKHPKGLRMSAPNVIVFWDVEKEDWRSFKPVTLIA